VLDEEALEAAVRVLGVKSYSEAVNIALKEAVRRLKVQSLGRFFGRGLWDGDLAAMREDRPRKRRGVRS
jgi:Arc/MetJ family transcription regulator